MANAKKSFFFSTKTVCFKTKRKVFLVKKKLNKNRKRKTKLTTEKRKKSWAKPNLSQVIIACGFSPEIQKSIFIRV